MPHLQVTQELILKQDNWLNPKDCINTVLTFVYMKINKRASQYVCMARRGKFWCSRKFQRLPKNRGLGYLNNLKKKITIDWYFIFKV